MKMIKKLSPILLVLSLIFSGLHSFSQSDSTAAFSFIRFQYSHLFPSGDYESTYGNSNAVGGAFGFKTEKNWQFEVEGNFMFGADVKRSNLLSDVINERGDAIDDERQLVVVTTDLRGLSFYASVGKVFRIFNSNPNSGLLTQFGAGYLQHRIFVDFRDGDVFQLSEERLKGYDRLHRGFSLKQFIGYQYFGNKNLVNFYIGLEIEQGFTRNVREYNYDTRSFDKGSKFDLLYGLRLGWNFPIRKRATDDYYYY